MFDLMMPEDELLESYRTCKDQKKQIHILADLNCTTVKEIRAFLEEKGFEVPEDGRCARRKGTPVAESIDTSNGTNDSKVIVPPMTVTEDINKPEVPESIRRILNERRRRLIEQIKKLQAEVNDINAFIGDYRKE